MTTTTAEHQSPGRQSRLGSLTNTDERVFMTDGGLETTLVFHYDIDLPDFAAFPLLKSDEGRSSLERYYRPYLDLAQKSGRDMVLDTPTWRANLDWGIRLGCSPESLAAANREAVAFVRSLPPQSMNGHLVVNGVIGPRGDGYVVGEAMSADEAASYHGLQVRSFADADVDMVTAVTMTYSAEAIGIVRATESANLPVVISFTVETDGSLPSGQSLADAISEVDAAAGSAPLFYMINCAHPSHFEATLRDGGNWIERIGAVRANASSMSHEELDNAETLDRGDVAQLAGDYDRLSTMLPNLRVIGGCCGTDHEHLEAIVTGLSV